MDGEWFDAATDDRVIAKAGASCANAFVTPRGVRARRLFAPSLRGRGLAFDCGYVFRLPGGRETGRLLDFEHFARWAPGLRSALFATSLGAIATLPAGCKSRSVERAAAAGPSEQRVATVDLDNAEFRRRVVAFVREASEGEGDVACTLPTIAAPLHVVVSLYRAGQLEGRARSTRDDLCEAVAEATREAVA
ncbi:MAG: hypothetical protein KC636_04575, partial [Myxococcales bacterium]|nr:hypothetical protein [Myxococcales bacterium]